MSTVLFPALAGKIKTQYAKAVKSNTVVFVESEVEDVEENGITVSLIYIHIIDGDG